MEVASGHVMEEEKACIGVFVIFIIAGIDEWMDRQIPRMRSRFGSDSERKASFLFRYRLFFRLDR